jgi:hypothetical protein
MRPWRVKNLTRYPFTGALRFISRILHVGSIRKLQIEDMLMAFVLVLLLASHHWIEIKY